MYDREPPSQLSSAKRPTDLPNVSASVSANELAHQTRMAKLGAVPLVRPTPSGWIAAVSADLDGFLVDHASCERKAVAFCVSLAVRYSDKPLVALPLLSLAKEEMEHFQKIYRLMVERGLSFAGHDKDQYINRIQGALRHGREERLLDSLVAFGLIEARGAERFNLLSSHLQDETLKGIYRGLAIEEQAHYGVFLRLARHYHEEAAIEAALARLALVEADAMSEAPLCAKLH